MKKRASDYVVEFIQEKIQSGEWTPGTKISTESQLQRETGFGKASIREAVESLCAMGILSKHQGDGTYVNDFKVENLFERLVPNLMLDKRDISSLLQFRKIMEPACVKLFIENNNTQKKLELEQSLNRMIESQQQNNHAALHEADRDFHRIICEGSENAVIVEIMKVLNEVLIRYHYTARNTIGERSGVEEHTAILKAIKSGDVELGCLLMQRHLERTIHDMRAYMEENP